MYPKCNPIPCTCATCGKFFFTLPSEIRRGGGKYCTRGCYFSRPPETRFWNKVSKTGPVFEETPCWVWLGGKSKSGYGTWREVYNGHLYQAHRVAYQLLAGPIPEGLHLHHRCRN